jgi:hypothetical protein
VRVNAKSNPLQNEFQFWCFCGTFLYLESHGCQLSRRTRTAVKLVYMSPDGYYMGLVEGQSHRPSSSSPDLAPEQRCIRDMASVGVTARDDQGLINVGKSIWTR